MPVQFANFKYVASLHMHTFFSSMSSYTVKENHISSDRQTYSQTEMLLLYYKDVCPIFFLIFFVYYILNLLITIFLKKYRYYKTNRNCTCSWLC